MNRNQKSFPHRKQNWKRHFVLNNINYFVLSFCLPSVLIRSNWQLICSKLCMVKLISILRQKIRISFWWKISGFRALHVAAVGRKKCEDINLSPTLSWAFAHSCWQNSQWRRPATTFRLSTALFPLNFCLMVCPFLL